MRRFVNEDRQQNNEYYKWFLVSNNLVSDHSMRNIENPQQSRTYIPAIKSPQNRALDQLFSENYSSRRMHYERKRKSMVGEKESFSYVNKELERVSNSRRLDSDWFLSNRSLAQNK